MSGRGYARVRGGGFTMVLGGLLLTGLASPVGAQEGARAARPLAPQDPAVATAADVQAPRGHFFLKQFYTGDGTAPVTLTSCTIGAHDGAMYVSSVHNDEIGDVLAFATNPPTVAVQGTVDRVIHEVSSTKPNGSCAVDGPPTLSYWYVPPSGISDAILVKEVCPPDKGLTSPIGDFLAAWIDTACPVQSSGSLKDP